MKNKKIILVSIKSNLNTFFKISVINNKKKTRILINIYWNPLNFAIEYERWKRLKKFSKCDDVSW